MALIRSELRMPTYVTAYRHSLDPSVNKEGIDGAATDTQPHVYRNGVSLQWLCLSIGRYGTVSDR